METFLDILEVIGQLLSLVVILALIFALPILLYIRKRQDRKDQKRIAEKTRKARERLEAKDKINLPDKDSYKPHQRWGRKWVNYMNSMKGPRPGAAQYSNFPQLPPLPSQKEK